MNGVPSAVDVRLFGNTRRPGIAIVCASPSREDMGNKLSGDTPHLKLK
jgi:hypothetical protein